MLYQMILCLLQTIATVVILVAIGIKFPRVGVISNFMLVDIGITVFLITYAADMMALFISAIVRSTTTAMTGDLLKVTTSPIVSGGKRQGQVSLY